jgi:S-adenosylmethionine:tRNA-ribosyltransferase-isomerase (queuine synthetase)
MKLDDFDFDLPERLIATRPARPRSSARLLVADGARRRAMPMSTTCRASCAPATG